jgi:ATP synthase protein I
MIQSDRDSDSLEEAAKREAYRVQLSRENPEPSLGSRLGQIGMLGWMIVIPALIGLWIGRLIDQWLTTGILFSAALMMLGVIAGFWFAWRWMHKQ